MTNANRHADHQGKHDQGERSKPRGNDAVRRAADIVEGNPIAILAGGLAVGAIAGALIPRSTREKELLAPLGRQLGERARAAAQAAREAGKQELAGLGISKDAARDQARGFLDGVVKAASSAGTAAKEAAANPQG